MTSGLSPWRSIVAGVGEALDVYGHLQRVALARAAPHASGRLLDVGCGNKPWREFFMPHVTEYIGVERQSLFALTAASGGVDQPDVLYDGERLPFDDGSFDTVVSFEVLEHSAAPHTLIAEMRRVLRPGGTLILSAPFSYRVHEAPHDYFRYTAHGLTALVETEGLRIEALWPKGGLWSVLSHKFNSHLVTEVGRLQGLGQQLGKFGQEAPQKQVRPRWWTLPWVVPALAVSTALGRVGDAVRP